MQHPVQKIYLLISAAWKRCVASINSSFEGTQRLMLDRNAHVRNRTHMQTPEKKTRASQLLSCFDTSDPGDPRCYYHHPQETETDCEKRENREQPADLGGPLEPLHIYSHSCSGCIAAQNAARGQTVAFAIRHVVSPCASRKESHPAAIPSSSLGLAAFFSFLSSTQRLLSERIKNWYCSFHVEIHFSQSRTRTHKQTHTLLRGFWWTFLPEWFQKGLKRDFISKAGKKLFLLLNKKIKSSTFISLSLSLSLLVFLS